MDFDPDVASVRLDAFRIAVHIAEESGHIRDTGALLTLARQIAAFAERGE
jgi:hypothetical protein